MKKPNKKYHLPEDLQKDYLRKCRFCGYVKSLDLSLSEQPEYWICPECGSKNKTFWTPSDDLRERFDQ
jgi:rubredoxin